MKLSTEQVENLDSANLTDLDEKLQIRDYTSKKHYVNNADLLEEYKKYYQKKQQWLHDGKGVPPLTNKIGKAIIQIATRRCNSRFFIGYSQSWKEEFISNAIMTATIHGHNFDPNKSSNPFAYLTQICNNAMISVIKKERQELYIRYKSIEDHDGFFANMDADDFSGMSESDIASYNDYSITTDDRRKFVSDFEKSMKKKSDDLNKAKDDNTGLFAT